MQHYAGECSKLVLEVLNKGPQDKKVVKSEVVITPVEIPFQYIKWPNAFIESEEAQELLGPLKEPGNSYSKICFSNRSFGLGGVLCRTHLSIS